MTVELLNKMKGKKHLIIGNHDNSLLKNKAFRDCFVEIRDYKEIRLENGAGIVLSHYPMICFNHHFHNWVHLYGHVHNSFEWEMIKESVERMQTVYHAPCRMFNVGVMIDYMQYEPKSLDEILQACERGE